MIVWRVGRGSLRHPDLVIYDHVHLAVLHSVIPTLRGIPYVVFLHGVEVWEPLSGRRRDALMRADLLLTNSATTEAEARKINPWLPTVKVIWLGVSKQKNTANVGASAPVAIMVGRMVGSERYKGHDEVLDAWPIIQAAVPNARLVMVGKGNDAERLRRRIETENLRGIDFCGRLTDSERDALYRKCRLLLLPSKGEGFGLAVVEAASFGLPVLGLAGTVTEELFPNGTGAVLAKKLDRASIAEAAITVLADVGYATKLGHAARARVESVFLEEHFAERFRGALSPLLYAARSKKQSS
jgi:phosphatidylinositol alpha-1,6-mannosyltransferase